MVLSPSARRRLAIGARLVMAWRPTGVQLIGVLRGLITSFVALGIALYVLPGRQSSGPLAVLVLVITVAGVSIVVRPLLLGLAVLLGSFGLLLVGFLAQVGILAIAVGISPEIEVRNWPQLFGAAWIAATVAAVLNWLLDTGSQDAFYAQVLGRVVRIAHRHALDAPAGEPGLVVVQLDGVGASLLRQAIVAGAVPTLSRWLRSGTHRVYRWHTGLPATTPAGQAVLLHGDVTTVPSFRWYDKAAGRLVVANHPRDAHEIEKRLTTGWGLLADGGVSISNLFSGDAPTRILTMSDAHLPDRTTRGLASFASTSLGFVRTIVVFAGQVVQEGYQARRQRRRDVRPRVPRGRVFALLRGVTTALLHDLNVAIVAEQMARDAPVVFVDFVDFDEIAHHAGPSRPESMRTLDGLDRVLDFLAQVAAEANRDYELVVVSDHGQAQGEPFDQLVGRTLDEVVADLCGHVTDAASAPAEQWGPANVLLTGAARSTARLFGRLARRRAESDSGERADMTVNLGAGTVPGGTQPVVASSGNLAHVYLPDVPGRATRGQIDARYPRLVDGLAAQPGIGLVMVRQDDGSLHVLGAGGWRSLTSPDGDGDDPLTVYGTAARGDLVDLDRREHVGDLVVIGRYDPDITEAAAFEELVGSHGGLGGDQTEAVLLVPSSWPDLTPRRPADATGGACPMTGVEVHRALLDRLRVLGLRPGDDVASPREPATVA